MTSSHVVLFCRSRTTRVSSWSPTSSSSAPTSAFSLTDPWLSALRQVERLEKRTTLNISFPLVFAWLISHVFFQRRGGLKNFHKMIWISLYLRCWWKKGKSTGFIFNFWSIRYNVGVIIKAKYKASDVAARLGLKIRLYCSHTKFFIISSWIAQRGKLRRKTIMKKNCIVT